MYAVLQHTLHRPMCISVLSITFVPMCTKHLPVGVITCDCLSTPVFMWLIIYVFAVQIYSDILWWVQNFRQHITSSKLLTCQLQIQVQVSKCSPSVSVYRWHCRNDNGTGLEICTNFVLWLLLTTVLLVGRTASKYITPI